MIVKSKFFSILAACLVLFGFFPGCSSNDSETDDKRQSPCIDRVKEDYASNANFEILKIKLVKREDAKLVIEDEALERKTKLLVDIEWTAKDMKGYTTCYCDEQGNLVDEPSTFFKD